MTDLKNDMIEADRTNNPGAICASGLLCYELKRLENNL